MSGAMGLLLVVAAATPAHAETVRSEQWHLDTMRAEEMWKISTGKGVTVAVIDTGIAALPELEGQVLAGGADFTNIAGDERDDYGKHGSDMASLIAGTGKGPGGDGAFGLAPGVKILPIRVPLGGGGGPTPDQAKAQAIRHAVDKGAKVISISMGRPVSEGDLLPNAVKYALGKGALIFAAVGNDGWSSPIDHPAGSPGVVGVAAVDKKINGTKQSHRGPLVDLAAPGADVLSGCVGDTGGNAYCKGDGTSASTALASASAALIWSKYPQWTNNQVLRVMLNTAGGPTSGAERNDVIGYGMVRPRIALTNPGDPGPADVYPLPDLAAAAPKSPSPDASQAAPGPDGEGEKQPTEAAAPAASEDDSGTGLWIALGVGAAVLIGAAVAVSVVRSRRRAAVESEPVPASAVGYPQQQSAYPSPYGPPPSGTQQYPEQPYSPQQAPYPPYGSPPAGQQQNNPPYPGQQ
ncbi:S8 family serine peptidase [Streptomyces albipurpureus]|uniref:S8 family serine peptidase n=1 Tax=Streptomyces albipurpureus TaxID=2897419 RepID=A0ABT0UYA3_9ACTN|nr:S8 family serine peptidase [Streptomyces sp. CWNU-1]MCM2392273.1 S8 family serine peptidase [Streptomyces sp. CWNU-1]